jgi:hypothetical protein
MDFDVGALLVSFLISGIGFVLLSYGRKMQRVPQIAAGLVLMISPYFTPGIVWPLAIALGVLALLWLAVKYGL